MRKAEVLEFAILGVLQDGPAHGYELRKRLGQVLGTFHAISFGSLYPALQGLLRGGLIAEEPGEPPTRRTTRSEAAGTRRNRIAYRLTDDGGRRFRSLLADAGPEAWDDDGFRAHFAFFGRAERSTRRRILEGRRMRLDERAALMRDALTRTRERVDAYTLELQLHGLESVEREMRWLDDLLAAEREQPE